MVEKVGQTQEVRIVLNGVSPTLANVVCSSTVVEALSAVADGVRRAVGLEEEKPENRSLGRAVHCVFVPFKSKCIRFNTKIIQTSCISKCKKSFLEL